VQTIGQFIREKRQAKNLSLRSLALQADITPPFLSDIELGKRFPSEKSRAKLAPLLGVEKEALDRFDYRQDIPYMLDLLRTNPALQEAFRNAMKRVRDGKITANDIADQFSQLAGLAEPPAGVPEN
jgi:transcriptional regulator with XRE-family HTH domain